MSFRTWYANRLIGHAIKVAVTKGDGGVDVSVSDRNLSIGVYDPGSVKEGNDRSLDGTLYNNGAIWLGSNANPTYVPESFDDDEADGKPVHSQKYKAEFENDIVEKFFGGNLERLVKGAIATAAFAALLSFGDVVLTLQNAG